MHFVHISSMVRARPKILKKNFFPKKIIFFFFMKNKDFFSLFFWTFLWKKDILADFDFIFFEFHRFLESSTAYGQKLFWNPLYHFLLFIANFMKHFSRKSATNSTLSREREREKKIKKFPTFLSLSQTLNGSS